MIRRLVVLVIVIGLTVFSSSRLDYSKSALTSNYLVLHSVEEQNINTVLESIKYNVPSFNIDAKHFNTSPYQNGNGDVEVYIGNMVKEDTLIEENLKGVNNNFMFRGVIDYNNTTKEVKYMTGIDTKDKIDTEVLHKNGETLNVITMR